MEREKKKKEDRIKMKEQKGLDGRKIDGKIIDKQNKQKPYANVERKGKE